MRRSGIAASSPSVVPIAMSSAYWLWYRSCDHRPRPKRIARGSTSPVAGSFMSFQMPARPERTCSALSRPHHARASAVAKSGNAVRPGQTCPT